MTLSLVDLALFAGALVVLFLTPGPVWVALVARAMAGGFGAVWPLALGVAVGDMVWSLLAVLGVGWIVSQWAAALVVLKWAAGAVFVAMGALIIRHAGHTIAEDSRLTRPGLVPGFLAGLAVIVGNPKAVLFYMGILPGFFDLAALTRMDVAAIVALAAVIPLAGNLVLGLFIGRVRAMLRNPATIRRTNLIAGGLLIAVGLVVPWL